MGRIAWHRSRSWAGWMPIVAVLVAGSVASFADEPKSKPSNEKKAESSSSTSKSKAKSKDKAEKADDSKAKTAEEKKLEEVAKLKDVALKVAEPYLVLLDKGKFGESWDTMTAEVRRGITRRKWMDALGKTRTPFGKLQRRKLNRIELRATEVAEKYDEAWVYTDFRTLEGVDSSELIIVVLEGGKNWTVNAYYIGDPQNFPKPPVLEDDPKPTSK